MEGLRATLRQALSLRRLPDRPGDAGPHRAGRARRAPPLRARPLRRRRDTTSTATALAYYGVGPRGLHGREGPGPRVLRAGLAARAAAGERSSRWPRTSGHDRAASRDLGFRAVALGTGLGSLVNAGVLLAVFERRVGGLRGAGLGGRLARILVAGARSWRPSPGRPGEPARCVRSARGASSRRPLTGLVPVVLGVAGLPGSGPAPAASRRPGRCSAFSAAGGHP